MIKNNQICDGYNPKVLMGNWYEQSYAVQQPMRQAPEKVARAPEVDIGFKNPFGNLIPLNRMARLQPWNTKGLLEISNDKTKQTNLNSRLLQTKSIMKSSYDLGTINNFHKDWKSRPYDKENEPIPNGKTHAQLNKVNNKYDMFNSSNIEQLKNHEVNVGDFRSQIKLNPHVNPKNIMETIYQKNFVPNKMEELVELNRTHEQVIMNTSNGKGLSSTSFNKLNMKKLSDQINNSGNIGRNTGTSGFYQQYNQNYMTKFNDKQIQSGSETNFRRIRSEITLKNTQFIKTFK